MKFIAVQGVSGSGKTTFCKRLLKKLPRCLVFNICSYYYDDPKISTIQNKHSNEGIDSELLTHDISLFLEKGIYIERFYDFGKRQSMVVEESIFENVEYIVIEGLHAFDMESLPEYWCRIYLHRDLEYALVDRMKRDYDAFDPEKKLKPIELYLDDVERYLLPTMQTTTVLGRDACDIVINTNTGEMQYTSDKSYSESFVTTIQLCAKRA